MGLFSRSKPKIKIQTSKKDGYSGWVKCTHCNELIHANQLQENKHCCPKCDYHYRLTGLQRIELLVDKDSFIEMYTQFKSTDPLTFVDTEAYADRLKKAAKATNRDEAAIVGTCEINNVTTALGVLDFSFMAGSMGSVVGEKIARAMDHSLKYKKPFLMISRSGGARMMEAGLSLMQMAKTSAKIALLDVAKIPYISLLTDPTTGGVTASYAMLGDFNIAEPNALIGFAGPRVIRETIGKDLPKGFQSAEFVLEHGFLDFIVDRRNLKNRLSTLLRMLQ